MKNNLPLVSGVRCRLFLLAMCAFYAASVCTDQSFARDNLTTQLEVLRNAQLAIQKDVEEIKKALQNLTAPGSPSPQNLTFNIDGEPFKGNKNAKVVLIEFSDFECPFCAKFHKETFPKINEEFISTGNVKFIVRDFPLESIHANAFKAAQVAKCAADQGKLWEMHDWLFAHQGQFSPEFFRHGRPIDLGEESFQQCLSSGKHDSVIRTS